MEEDISFSTLSSPTSHRTLQSATNHLSPYFKRASRSYIEFEFLTSVDQRDGGGLSRLVPLKLPPRLQISPSCPTPTRSRRRGSAPRRAAGLRDAKNNKEFDPFTAALERIRKEEQERLHESEMAAGSTSPTTTHRESGAKHRRGIKSSVLLSSAGRNHIEVEAEDNDGDHEIKLECSSSPSVFCYKPNLLACFILKK